METKVDKGTETGTMSTIHAFLRRHDTDVTDPVDTILYGPSTSNQVSKLISRCLINLFVLFVCLYAVRL